MQRTSWIGQASYWVPRIPALAPARSLHGLDRNPSTQLRRFCIASATDGITAALLPPTLPCQFSYSEKESVVAMGLGWGGDDVLPVAIDILPPRSAACIENDFLVCSLTLDFLSENQNHHVQRNHSVDVPGERVPAPIGLHTKSERPILMTSADLSNAHPQQGPALC